MIQFVTNTISLTTPNLTAIGVAISPLAALINHSCDPNSVLLFPRDEPKTNYSRIKIVAIKPIHEKEEVRSLLAARLDIFDIYLKVTISYIDTTLPRENRQKALQETYNFKCRCSLCAAFPPTVPDARESLWCPNRCGGTCSLQSDGKVSYEKRSLCSLLRLSTWTDFLCIVQGVSEGEAPGKCIKFGQSRAGGVGKGHEVGAFRLVWFGYFA
jgi:hypothetical protein